MAHSDTATRIMDRYVAPVIGCALLVGLSASLIDTYSLDERGDKFCTDLQENFNSASRKFADIIRLENVPTEQTNFEVNVRSTAIGGFIPLNNVTCTVSVPAYTK